MKKIWISRQNSRIRKIKNYHEVEKILKSNGFNIVDFDKKIFGTIKDSNKCRYSWRSSRWWFS